MRIGDKVLASVVARQMQPERKRSEEAEATSSNAPPEKTDGSEEDSQKVRDDASLSQKALSEFDRLLAERNQALEGKETDIKDSKDAELLANQLKDVMDSNSQAVISGLRSREYVLQAAAQLNKNLLDKGFVDFLA